MQTYQIILLVLLGIIAVVTLILYASYRAVLKRGTQFVTVGTVEHFQEGKIPFLGSAVVSYTKSGRPYQARTNIIPRGGSRKRALAERTPSSLATRQKGFSCRHASRKARTINIARLGSRPVDRLPFHIGKTNQLG